MVNAASTARHCVWGVVVPCKRSRGGEISPISNGNKSWIGARHDMMHTLVNGCSFTSGHESELAWPTLVPHCVNIAVAGASNDYIMRSTIQYVERYPIHQAIIAWTSPNRIEISGQHLTPTSSRRYGVLVDHVFGNWDSHWAFEKFMTQVQALHGYLENRHIRHVFVSAFDIQPQAIKYGGTMPSWYLGWPDQGLVEWMGDCELGPGGHPLVQGHQRIAAHINEHLGNIGWLS